MGKKRKYAPPLAQGPLFEMLQQYEDTPTLMSTLLKGHVIHLYVNCGGRSPSTTSQLLLQKICPDAPPSSLKVYISDLASASISKFKNLSRASDRNCLEALLRQPFHVPELRCGLPSVDLVQPQECAINPMPAAPPLHSPMKTRTVAKCDNCRDKNMALRNCLQAKEQARKKHFLEMRELKRHMEPIWKLNATIARRDKTIKTLRDELNLLK